MAAIIVSALGAVSVAAEDAATPAASLSGFHGPDQPGAYQGQFSDLVAAIDDYWSDEFRAAGAYYASPGIVVVDRELLTNCGRVRPVPNAFYCPGDRTIYLVPQFLLDEQNQFGDYAPVAILAHEWGHHVQVLAGVSGQPGKAHELQADCLMGAFTAFADQGLCASEGVRKRRGAFARMSVCNAFSRRKGAPDGVYGIRRSDHRLGREFGGRL
jgi:predicted metalloprotease